MNPNWRGEYQRLVELSFMAYAGIRQEYWRDVNGAVTEYLSETTKDDSWFTSTMRAAVELAFVNAALVAWQDGVGDENTTLGVSGVAFLTAYKLAHFSFIESLLLSLRVHKYPSEEEDALDDIQVMTLGINRADGYASGLDMLYNNEKVRGAASPAGKNQLLLFTGDDGMESCFDCQKYKGKKHPASWWIYHNAIPPNRDFECKGYNCLHILLDVVTNKIFTI